MKKLFIIVLVLVMALSLCSCKETDIGEIVNKEISHGTIDGNVYTSDYLGITFNAPDGWKYATDEELAAMVDAALDITDYNSLLYELQVVYDMMAVDPLTNSNVIINFENLSVTGNENMTVDEYVEITKNSLNAVEVFTYTFGGEEKITFGGKEYTKVSAVCEYNGVVMKQVYYVTKIDNYIAYIIVTVTDSTPVETIEGYISDID